MTLLRRARLGVGITLAAVGLTLICPAARAAEKVEDLRFLASRFEEAGDWARACAFYAYILSRDPAREEVRQRFQTCLRHFHRARRHGDAVYRDQVLKQDIAVGLKVYGEVLSQLQAEYLEGEKADLNRLFHQGLEELRLALKDETFCRAYLPGVKPEAVTAFLVRVNDTWGQKVVRYQLDAQSQVLQVALAAKKALGLKPTVTILEFACGACNALDEHTYYLPPSAFQNENGALRGEAAGVGLDVEMDEDRLVIKQITTHSPAARAGLLPGDVIRRIDGDPAGKLSLEAAFEKLRGKVGTVLELEVVAIDGKATTYRLTRQLINMSVTDYHMLELPGGMATDIGYIQLTTFHEHALRELNEAVRQLELQGMRSLVLDLRDNPGGLFEAGVRVAERFLEEGADIVLSRSRTREGKRTSHNPTPFPYPVVVLVNGNTASAAELVAGALKENGRATLVGQTTLGKHTVQQLVELKTVQAGGVRITWARFCSPLGRNATGGIVPHVLVPDFSQQDEQLQAAMNLLGRQMQ